MGLTRGSAFFGPDGRFAAARFRRWFGVYYLAAVLVFAFGAALGAVAIVVSDLSGLESVADGMGSFLPEEITFRTLVQNNLLAVGVTALGLVSFGLVAVASLFLNGFILGLVLGGAAADGTLVTALALVLPHGILELGAFFLVAAVSFRVTHRFVNYLRGIDDAAITGQELFEVVVLLAVAALGIVVAAWIEAEVTTAVARALVGPL